MPIKRLLVLLLAAYPVFAQQQHDQIRLNSGASIVQSYVAGGTITAGHIVKLNSSAQAIEALTTDTAGVVGIAVNSAVLSGSVTIAFLGQATLTADAACTTGNYITISPTIIGNAHCQAAIPTTQFLGISLTTIGSAGSITGQVNVGNDGSNAAGASGANTALSNLAAVAINTSLVPVGAGTQNLATALLPFGDIFIGGSASHALDFNVTGLTTNRQVTWPDAAGTIPLLGFGQTWSGVQTHNAGTLLLNPGPLTFTSAAAIPRTVTFADNSGTVAELNLAETWSANQFFAANQLLLNPGPITLASAGSAARTATLPDNTGTVAELNLIQTWTAAQTVNAALSTNAQFTDSVATGTAPLAITSTTPVANLTVQNCDTCNITTSIAPSTAGGIALGTTPLPFSGVKIGTAATNNILVNGTATAARTITLPDATGNSEIGLNGCQNATPVTVSAAVVTDQNLMACTIPANTFNVSLRTLKIWAAGVYTTPVATTPTIQLKAKLCTVSGCGSGTVISLINITTTATVASITNDAWNLLARSTTQTTGASSAYEAHGVLSIDLAALTTATDSIFNDINIATVGTIDSTAQLFLQVSVAFSIANAGNTMTQRQLSVELSN